MNMRRSLCYMVGIGKTMELEQYLTYSQPRIKLIKVNNLRGLCFDIFFVKCMENPGTVSEVERIYYHRTVPVHWKITIKPVIVEQQS